MKWLTPLFVILVEHSRYSVQSQAYCLILTMGFCGKRPPKDQLILYSEFTVGNLDFFKSKLLNLGQKIGNTNSQYLEIAAIEDKQILGASE